MFLIKNIYKHGCFDTPVIMNKNNQIQILTIVSALSTVMISNGAQYQQQQNLAFGQTPETSVEGNQTFRSAFDTFVSSEPGDTVSMRIGNLTSSKQEKHSCYMLNL